MDFSNLHIAFLNFSGWILMFLILILLRKVYFIYRNEKRLNSKLIQRCKNVISMQLDAKTMQTRNMDRNAILSEQLERMKEQLTDLKGKFNNEIHLLEIESAIRTYEITLSTYTRVWQKL